MKIVLTVAILFLITTSSMAETFFFTPAEKKYCGSSTSFDVGNGKLIYAETRNPGMRSGIVEASREAVLARVEKALRSALADLDPEPSFEYPRDTKSLVVKHQTRKFMIHSVSMIGKYSQKVHEEDGPSYKGFMLRLHLQKAGFVNQAVVPQTIRRPYWRTDLDVTVIKGTDKQLYWGLSYGSRVDRKLLKKVKSVVNALGKK
jgi:hypothetical protein